MPPTCHAGPTWPKRVTASSLARFFSKAVGFDRQVNQIKHFRSSQATCSHPGPRDVVRSVVPGRRDIAEHITPIFGSYRTLVRSNHAGLARRGYGVEVLFSLPDVTLPGAPGTEVARARTWTRAQSMGEPGHALRDRASRPDAPGRHPGRPSPMMRPQVSAGGSTQPGHTTNSDDVPREAKKHVASPNRSRIGLVIRSGHPASRIRGTQE